MTDSPTANPDARKVVRATRLSKREDDALAQAVLAEMAATPSTYIADATRARLIADGFLTDAPPPAEPPTPEEAPGCEHKRTSYNGIFRVCQECGEIVKR